MGGGGGGWGGGGWRGQAGVISDTSNGRLYRSRTFFSDQISSRPSPWLKWWIIHPS